MKDEKFKKVINQIDVIYNNSKKVIDPYSIEMLISESDEYINNYFEQAEKVQGAMDNMICDFYHIIGMSDLSAPQTSTLVKHVKDVLSTRNQIKTIVSIKGTVKSLRGVKTLKEKSKYKIKILETKNSFNL